MNHLLVKICNEKFKSLRLNSDPRYVKRLKWELEEIESKEKSDYFWNLYVNKVKYPENQNNLLICWLLEIVPDFSIEREPECEYGEYPDIDIDYIPIVRSYLKEEWAPKHFGSDRVCNIGNYTTFKIKSALLDMARVHGANLQDVQALTKSIEDKDDDGKNITWDAALKMYPQLVEYCKNNPEVTIAAQKLIGRNRGTGVHAAGLIIANSPLYDLVPLMKRKDSPQASAWTEGLNRQDLSPIGLVKFDLLVIDKLLQLARCCEMVKKRHNLDGVCNKPGQSDWSDTNKWRDDKASLEMANRADLQCVFQFDSPGIRGLVKAGGVTRFEDIAAYSALFRPGPLSMKMDQRYVERKQGREKFILHPLVKPILEKTYGVLVYQEQIMKILNIVGEIPLKDCEMVRKAISKKNIAGFIKYKEAFVINGQKNLGSTEAEALYLWNQIEAFSEYGFNASVLMSTKISYIGGEKEIQNFVSGDIVFCVNEQGETVETEVVALHDHGELQGYEVTFDDGYKITCSANHKFLTEKGQVSLKEIYRTRSSILSTQQYRSIYAEKENRWMENTVQSGVFKQKKISQPSKELRSMQESKIVSKIRKIKTYCSLRRKNVNNRKNVGTSKKLQTMSSNGMEKIFRNVFVSLRSRVQNYFGERRSFKNLRYLHRNKKTKYSGKNGKTQFRQSVSREKEDFFRYSKKNFNTTRFINKEGRKFEKMARGKSRKVCQIHRSCMEGTKIISNGNLVKKSNWMGFRKNSLWQRSKTSGFCKRQYLDRSGRIFSFFRTQEQFGESIQTSNSTSQRQNVERGVYEKRQRDAFKIEHGVFSFVNRSDETRNLGLGANHASITDTRNLVSRKIVRIMPVGRCHMFDLEVANPTHNFLLPNGIVTSNSHTVSYTYISMWMLYLKCHYPHEFYASLLSCESSIDKIKEYKIESKVHGVQINYLDINKSGINFELKDNDIYYGFSKIKGIGEEPAKRIVAEQPYQSFEDFLTRFGTDASVLKPVIGLRCFKERDPITLWKFAEHFKDCFKKIEEKKKRFINSMDRYEVEFKELVPNETRLLSELAEKDIENPFDSEYWNSLFDKDEETEIIKEVKCDKDTEGAVERTFLVDVKLEDEDIFIQREEIRYFCKKSVKKVWNRWKVLRKLWQKRNKSIELYKRIESLNLPNLAEFDPNEFEINDVLLKEFRDIIACEEKYYGFAWIHELEKSPDYKGFTFDAIKDAQIMGPVEFVIKKVVTNKSKKGVEYKQVFGEDVTGKENKINIWAEDWSRWHQELKAGNLIRARLQPPSGGFNTYLLESNQAGKWRGQLKYVNKDDDPRVVIMKKGQQEEEIILSDDEAFDLFSNLGA